MVVWFVYLAIDVWRASFSCTVCCTRSMADTLCLVKCISSGQFAIDCINRFLHEVLHASCPASCAMSDVEWNVPACMHDVTQPTAFQPKRADFLADHMLVSAGSHSFFAVVSSPCALMNTISTAWCALMNTFSTAWCAFARRTARFPVRSTAIIAACCFCPHMSEHSS